MKKNCSIFAVVLFSLLFNISTPLFAEESTNNEKDEIPQVMKDIRRFEIITLGSLPFVLLDASLVYSGIKYAQNDFDKAYKPSFNQSNLTKDEQTGVLLTSLGICLGIGVTDLIVNLVKRNKEKKRQELRNSPIEIEPISEDENAIMLDKIDEVEIIEEQ